MLKQLRAKLAALLEARKAHEAKLTALMAAAEEGEGRDLNEAEAKDWAEARSAIQAIDEQRGPLQERIADLENLERNNLDAAAAAERLGDQVPGDVTHARVTGEPSVYTRDGERRHGVSFFRDVMTRQDDPSAQERLVRHMNETRDLIESRDVGTGAFAGLVVPQYLTDLVAPKRRAGRPVADICNRHDLPATGMTVNISRITTGTAAAPQATENSGVQETDIDDTLLTVNVRTISGQQDVSRQALDRGQGTDQIVLEDLVSDYNTKLDGGIINDDGTSGTHLGIRSTTSIIAVTYTDADPTAAEAYPKLADLIQQIQAGVFMGISHFVMHPRRWWWFAAAIGSTFPLLQSPGNPQGAAGQTGGTDYTSTGRNIFGVPVVVDGNMLTNIGAGTEDVILGVTSDELHLWEDPGAPLRVRAEQTTAGSLTVKLVVYGYSAFTAGRYPGAHGKISGTGLIAPSF